MSPSALTLACRKRLLLVLAALLVHGACEPSFQARYEEVLPGDRRDRVVALLGEPRRAGWLTVDPFVVGPPEVLFGVAPEGALVEELTWTVGRSGDKVIYQVYLDEAGRVLAMTHHSEHDVF